MLGQAELAKRTRRRECGQDFKEQSGAELHGAPRVASKPRPPKHLLYLTCQIYLIRNRAVRGDGNGQDECSDKSRSDNRSKNFLTIGSPPQNQ